MADAVDMCIGMSMALNRCSALISGLFSKFKFKGNDNG